MNVDAAVVTSPLHSLGEVDVGGEIALIIWPQLGDAVAIDFKSDGHRYGLVSWLNTPEPQLLPNPLLGRQISDEQQPLVLAAVAEIWAASRASRA